MTTTTPDPHALGQDAIRHTPAPLGRHGTTVVRKRFVSGDLRGALLLIAPLAVFMLVFFVTPIVNLMTRSVWDPVVVVAFPETVKALRAIPVSGGAQGDASRNALPSATALPPASVYAALAADIIAADNAGTLGDAASRLNQDLSGMRILLTRTRRHLEDGQGSADVPPSAAKSASSEETAVAADRQKADLVAFDTRWGNPTVWDVLTRALNPLTRTYVLHALDHAETPEGHIVAVSRDEGVYLPILGRTLWISALVTMIVLALGYPLSYWLTGLSDAHQRRVMIAILIPFWTSILVRIAAWMVVLPREGLVNKLAIRLHLIHSPVDLLYNRTGVIISMVHILLPVMVLPLFSVMRGIPRTFQMAAVSLGSHPFGAFWRVYVPQTVPGVGAGTMLVFISALGYYIAPALLGGAGDQMLSYYIAYFTNTTINWGLAAALSVLLIAATVLLFVLYRIAFAVRRTASGA